jgi:hypothetical protein
MGEWFGNKKMVGGIDEKLVDGGNGLEMVVLELMAEMVVKMSFVRIYINDGDHLKWLETYFRRLEPST